MTTNSGDHYTCLIPLDLSDQEKQEKQEKAEAIMKEKEKEKQKEAETQAAKNLESAQQNLEAQTETEADDIEQEIQLEEDLEFEDQFEDDDEDPIIEKTTDELLQEADTLDARNEYLLNAIKVLQQKERSKSRRNKNNRDRNNRKRRRSGGGSGNSNTGGSSDFPCFEHKDGYWSYNICLYDIIMQYHDQRRQSPSFSLGKYTDFVDVPQLLMDGSQYELYEFIQYYNPKLFTQDDKFLHLLYINGDQRRTSLVTIVCPSTFNNNNNNNFNININNNKKEDGIIQLSEPRPHFYHFLLAYSPICEYQKWLLQELERHNINNMYHNNNNAMQTQSSSSASVSASLSEKKKSLLQLSELLSGSSGGSGQSDIDMTSDDIALLLSPLEKAVKRRNQCLILVCNIFIYFVIKYDKFKKNGMYDSFVYVFRTNSCSCGTSYKSIYAYQNDVIFKTLFIINCSVNGHVNGVPLHGRFLSVSSIIA